MNLNNKLVQSTAEEFHSPGFIEEILGFFRSLISMDKEDDKFVGLLKYNRNITYKPKKTTVKSGAYAYNQTPFANNIQTKSFNRAPSPAYAKKIT